MNITRYGAQWTTVLNVARLTQNQKPLDKEPSDKWKRKLTRSRHSPLRLIEFLITGSLPGFVLTHISRHKYQQIFIGTGRTDIMKTNDRPLDTDLRPFALYINADAFLTLYEARSCFKASLETRVAVEGFRHLVSTVEPIISEMCYRPCAKYGKCQEFTPCGFMQSEAYTIERERFLGVTNAE